MTDGAKQISYSYGESSLAGKSVPGGLNEDSISSFLQPVPLSAEMGINGVFSIADGFGGAGLGDAASRETVNLIRSVFSTGEYIRWARSRGIDIGDFLKILRATVSQINCVINDYAVKKKRLMGASLDVLVLKDGRFCLAHVGSGRIYLVRKGVVYRLTQDHPAETGAGAIDRAANVLGNMPQVSIDVFADDVQYGDAFVICSDGLTKAVDEDEIKYALTNFETPKESAEKLAKLADKRDGTDNISVTVIKTVVPAHEVRPSVKRVPIPEIRPKTTISPKVKTIATIGLIVLAVLLAGLVAYRFLFKAPLPVFIVQVNTDNTVRLTIQNIAKDDQYYIYRQENEPFIAESDALPNYSDTIGPLTMLSSFIIDDSVEPGKTYFYTAYRILPGWARKIDLKSKMTERAIIGGMPAITEEASEGEPFTQIYNHYMRLRQNYGSSLSLEQKERLLDTVSDYKKIIEEIRDYTKELRLIEERTDLVINNKNPKMLALNLNELEKQMEKTISKEGFEPYLAALRDKAAKTSFAGSPFADIASLIAKVNNSSWKEFEPQLEILKRLIEMDRDMGNGFLPDKNISVLVQVDGLDAAIILSDFYSSATLKKPETMDAFYKINKTLTKDMPLAKGIKILIPNPEYEIGGEKLAKRRDDLIGELSPYSYAVKNAAKINEKNLAKDYTELVELYKLKALYWYEVNRKSKKMEENLRNLDTEGMKNNRLYPDSYLKKVLVQPKLGAGTVEKKPEDEEIQKRIKEATEEFERLSNFFEQGNLEADVDAFNKAVKEFMTLKEKIIAEDEPGFDGVKELISAKEAGVDFLIAKIAGDAKALIEQADDLVESAGEDETARDTLNQAKSLYEKALLIVKSDSEKKDIENKINTATGKLAALDKAAETSGTEIETPEAVDFGELRWKKEVNALSLPESLVYLNKLTDGQDEIAAKLKENNPEMYSTEIEAAVKRAGELRENAQTRIIQKIEPLGPDFDEKKFSEGIAELRFIAFAFCEIVKDPKISEDFAASLENFSDQIKNGILKNHLSFDGAAKKIRKVIPEAFSAGDEEIKTAFAEIIPKETLESSLAKDDRDKFVGDVRVFADDIAERTEKNLWGRGDSYFVELILIPKHGEVFAASRKLWDSGLPLLRLKFHADKISKDRSYKLAMGWYKNRGYAEEASSKIQDSVDIKDLISSVTVRGKSEY